jgi:hypothetical protein
MKWKPADPLGIQRVVSPQGVLPQQADRLDPSLPLAEDELLIEVESLNIDSASFRQISEICAGDLARIEKHILDLVEARGKYHDPVMGPGGMLLGKVIQIGPRYPTQQRPVEVGDRIATLVSLSLTPLQHGDPGRERDLHGPPGRHTGDCRARGPGCRGRSRVGPQARSAGEHGSRRGGGRKIRASVPL